MSTKSKKPAAKKPAAKKPVAKKPAAKKVAVKKVAVKKPKAEIKRVPPRITRRPVVAEKPVAPEVEAIDTAKAIGVTCRLRGAIPEGGTPRTVLAAAIRECASNLRKHADGDLLQVTMEETGGTLRFTLCGNGAPPRRPVAVTGGLASLRTLAQNAGGEMKIDAAPAFTVTIELPN